MVCTTVCELIILVCENPNGVASVELLVVDLVF